jgi:UDP-N-acetylmuramate: L-alanyl-gamma-D-glutamyl-meso-diaminopimelate ligase
MKVHFIAIGGSAMHNLAIALTKKGYQVTGSDDAIYEPSWSRLKQQDILPAEMGWFPGRVTPDLDAVILGMHARADNPELLKAQELGLKIYSYPEYIYEQSKDKIRLVIGGSHGKTTITSMILHVLKETGRNTDYLVGAQLKGFDTMVRITKDAPVIVIEGDEYLSSPVDRRPKFHLYHASIGVISGIAWDHINVFPTFSNYKEQFNVFLDTIVSEGTVIYCEEDAEVKDVVENSGAAIKKIPYRIPAFTVRDGITALKTETGEVPLRIFGKHNLLNLTAARLACRELGVHDAEFNRAIAGFEGAARRLELLGTGPETAIFKDFAHSPSKLKATIEAVKEQFPDRKLLAVMELHTFSSLNKDFLKEYKGCMDHADEAIVFIDEHTFEQKKIVPFDKSVIKAAFGDERVKFFNYPEKLEEYLGAINYKCRNLLLMSSGNFAGINLLNLASRILKNQE